MFDELNPGLLVSLSLIIIFLVGISIYIFIGRNDLD